MGFGLFFATANVTMHGVSIRFIARIVLLLASFVLGILSLTNHTTAEEFGYAAGSIAAAMLATSIKTHRRHHQPKAPAKSIPAAPPSALSPAKD